MNTDRGLPAEAVDLALLLTVNQLVEHASEGCKILDDRDVLMADLHGTGALTYSELVTRTGLSMSGVRLAVARGRTIIGERRPPNG